MQVRIQPRNPSEALHGLQEFFQAASAAAATLRDGQRRLGSAAGQLAATRRQGGATLLQDLADAARGTRRASADAASADTETVGHLAALNRRKDESLTALADQALGLLEVVEAAGGNADRRLAELEQKLGNVRALGARRGREMLQQLQGAAKFFSLFERGQRAVQVELGKLKNHFAEQAESRGQREFSGNRAKAVRATKAGLRALQAGAWLEAEAQFREACARCPSPEVVFNLALALVLAGKREEPHRLLSAAALAQCDPAEVQALKALKALQVQDWALARQEAEAGLQIRPDHAVLRRLAATAALATNAAATAVRYLSKNELATMRIGVADLADK